MKVPVWRNVNFHEGVLPEPSPDDTRLHVWLPEGRDGKYQYWERIGTVARAPVAERQGLGSTAATSIRSRRPIRASLGSLFRQLRGATNDRALLLPNGVAVEPCGERRTDLLVAWSEDETQPLDEARVRSAWPEGKLFREIGKNLFVVSGIEASRAGTEREAEPVPAAVAAAADAAEDGPRGIAEQLLARARTAGDRRAEASALTDLGIIHHEEGHSRRSVELLEEALTLAQQFGESSRESDVLVHLGMAYLVAGQTGRGREVIERGLAYAREAGDRQAEKAALSKLGYAYSSLGELDLSLAAYEQASALAVEVGDRLSAAKLSWNLAILHADQGQRGQAVARARKAVGLFESLRRPEAVWFADHLRRYQAGDPATRLGGAVPGAARPEALPGAFRGGPIEANPASAQAGQDPSTSGPGLLRKALSARKAMATFLGPGLKTAPADIQQERLETCAACEHHTGLRCRICGCFTQDKVRILHEDCPLGKWPVFIEAQRLK